MPNSFSRPPILLAIEVIGRDGSVAILADGHVIATRTLPEEYRAASSLIPAVRDLLDTTQLIPDCIGVAIGPGSFTGLRIAVTAAKSLAYAWKIPVAAVDSLAAIAQTVPERTEEAEEATGERRILIGLNAYRGQVFRGRFVQELASGDGHGVGIASESATALVSGSEWAAELQKFASGPAGFVLAGDRSAFERTGMVLGESDWNASPTPRSVGVGRIATRMVAAGQTMSPFAVTPNYFRPSAAEESNSTNPPRTAIGTST